MSTSENKAMSGKHYWRSLADRDGAQGYAEHRFREFPEGASELETDGLSRRTFMGLMSASAALAGAGLPGCVRKPAQYIMPYANRPEDLVPGEPRFFASVLNVGGNVQGVLVESQDGRPTKIEGNPSHPASRGRTDARTQAAVLDVYDYDRSRCPVHNGTPTTLEAAEAAIRAHFGSPRTVAILTDGTPSPTLRSLINDHRRWNRGTRVFHHGADVQRNTTAGVEMVTSSRAMPWYDTSAAKVLVSLDADFLASGPNAVANAAGFADGRGVEDLRNMNRLYVVEPAFTTTGAAADERLQLAGSQIGEFAKALARYLLVNSGDSPPGAGVLTGRLSARSAGERFDAWVEAVGGDLRGHRGESVVVVGERQPPWVHALGHLINETLGNIGRTVHFVDDPLVPGGDLTDLVAEIDAGSFDTLLIIGGNPVFDAPADVDFAAAMAKVEAVFQLAYHRDETGMAAQWHIPASHPLEAWGDLIAADGTIALQQPLIEPLFPSLSPIEFMELARGGEPDGRNILRLHWAMAGAGRLEQRWQEWLHEGVLRRGDPRHPTLNWDWSALGAAVAADTPPPPTAGAYEVAFALDSKVYDGRYANNAWLQELPDTVSKLTWDNAALIGPATARSIGIPFYSDEDDPDVPSVRYAYEDAPMVSIGVGGRSIEIVAHVVPGVAENVVVLPLGYGRRFGYVAQGAGFDTYRVRASDARWIAMGATVTRAAGEYRLATTQDHWSLEGRAIYREGTVSELVQNPEFVRELDLMEPGRLHSLWEQPNVTEGQQWGMSIDLTTCIGCNVCTIACQAENNISIVGKQRVLEGREMHWIRLDRYFAGDADNPSVAVQPVGCMHCETAPCEQVCPVAATTHGPEGLNDMAYNRCIGTRYCSNNCPYKVRRFNFFNYSQENDRRNPLSQMQKNPDVTVRFRGVMEKCTYCTQRITAAKINAKITTEDAIVVDGSITPACAQACPTNAIVFGDVNDPESRVSRLRAKDHNFGMLAWLNVHPRTTYLARISNPNPELA